MPYRPELIVSGGQSGADQAALSAARELGIPTGGTTPKGWKTEDGPAPWLADYGLVESDHESYINRTIDNIAVATGTFIVGRSSRGSSLTVEECEKARKPYLWLGYPGTSNDACGLRSWCVKHGIRVLNVAGNRESVTPGIGLKVRGVLIEAFAPDAPTGELIS